MKIFKKKKLSILIHVLLSTLCFGENVVELDLNADTMTSTEGLEANYGDVTLNVLEARRDKEKNKVYIDKPFTARLKNPAGRGYLKADKGEMTLDGENGEFYKATGYLEVGMATNAEYPNDKIYYGGDKIDYENGNILLTNGWFTTDPKIRKVEDPKKVGYHLISETTLIEPDKQMTLENIDFYKGDKSYLPFQFPWYRVNIRPTSTVPLFPAYSSGDDDYGFSTTMGTLWGKKDDKYKGGFAPKYSDKLGLMIGRMENWYETDDFGTSKWNVTDAIIDEKDSDVDRRFHNELLHNYSGKYGNFDASVISATNNMIPTLDDTIQDYKDRNFWNKKGLEGKEVKETDRTEFITLESELEGMGKNKDISMKTNVKQVTDKDSYDLMLFDEFDDDGGQSKKVSEDGTTETSLYSQFALYKDNDQYKIGGYYNYLQEMAPGYTALDRSRDESFGFEIHDKVNKLHANYDKSTRDKYRPLTFMEQHEDLDPSLFSSRGQELDDTITGQYGDYTLTSIPEYNKYNSENFKFVAGEYSIGSFTNTSGYTTNKIENELSLIEDPTRDGIKGNERDKQYNRYNNIIYEERIENRGWTTIGNKKAGFTLGGGREKVEIWDREGIYNDDTYDFDNLKEGKSYKKYEYESEFVDYKFEVNPYKVGELGKFGVYAGSRYDQYSNQEVTGYDDSQLADNSTRVDLGFSHEQDFLKKNDNTLNNSFKYSYQQYDEENILLNHKENFNKFQDNIKFGTSSLDGEYKVTYDSIDNAATDDKKNRVLNNELDFKFSEDHKIKFNYGSNERYTDDNESEKNKNDLTFKNYGFNYKLNKHTFDYKREEIDYEIWDIEDTDDSFEEIDVDTFKYSFEFKNKDKITFGYTMGEDKRENYNLNETEIDTKKRIYSTSYYDYGVRYDNTYSTSYGRNRYSDDDVMNSYSTDTYSFGYTFLDKSMDPEFLKVYALKEYDKDEEQLTTEDLDNAASLLKERQQKGKQGMSKFNTTQSFKRPIAFTGDYNRKFSITTFAEKNKEMYDQTGDFMDSLEDVGFNVGYSQRRIGVGFGYSKEVNDKNGWINGKSGDEEEEYKVMLNMKVGKPSEGYRVTFYGKWEQERYYDDNGNDDGREMAKDIGVELGKEMGYYEWSIAFLTEYDYGSRDNDWEIALQFALLTFPDMPIFGIGGKQDAGSGASTSPTSSFMSGLKASDVDLDD